MKNFIKFISTWRATLIMLGIYAIVMAIATLVEPSLGTPAVKAIIYNSWWFGLLHILLIVNFIAISVKLKLIARHRLGALALHYGFAVIIAGAIITHFISYEGFMHIREGEKSSQIVVDNHVVKEVPFEVTLKDFNLVRYQGSKSPSSYESDVIISYNGVSSEQRIFMNNIARVGGFRIYQTSYDADEKGTILTVSHDNIGTAVTYVGYLMLILGLVISIFQKGSRFRALYASLGKSAVVITLTLLTFNSFGATSSYISVNDSLSEENAGEVLVAGKSDAVASGGDNTESSTGNNAGVNANNSSGTAVNVIVPSEAQKFGELMILSPDGRVGVINTYSSEILRKIYHRNSFRGMNGDQVLMGLISDPQTWSRIPIIYVSVKEVAQEIGADGKHIAYIDLFDSQGNYKLNSKVERIYQKPPQDRSKSDKEWLKIDEKINIIYSLFNGAMMPIFPTESGQWLSPADNLTGLNTMDSIVVKGALGMYLNAVRSGDNTQADILLSGIKKYQTTKTDGASSQINQSRLKAELLYNRADIFRMSFRLYLIFGFLLMLTAVCAMNSVKPTPGSNKSTHWAKLAITALTTIIICVFLYHTFGIGLRWYISGRAPWSNAYESMVYVAWTTVLAGMIFARKSTLVLSLATLLGGVILFVSNLNWLDPQITQLAPVLKSYWLMLHVSVITASYGFFGMCTMCGIGSLVSIISGRKLPELRKINELAMTIGLVLMTIGIFFGAIWANESWGRYWGWDPKETWALITMVVYAMITHSHFIPKLNNDFAFAAMSVTAISTVLMTFFGVNYYLSGLHSYGNNGGSFSFVFVGGVSAAIIVLILWAWRRFKGSVN